MVFFHATLKEETTVDYYVDANSREEAEQVLSRYVEMKPDAVERDLANTYGQWDWCIDGKVLTDADPRSIRVISKKEVEEDVEDFLDKTERKQ